MDERELDFSIGRSPEENLLVMVLFRAIKDLFGDIGDRADAYRWIMDEEGEGYFCVEEMCKKLGFRVERIRRLAVEIEKGRFKRMPGKPFRMQVR